MTSRSQRRQIAQETVAILEQGFYRSPSGVTVDLSGDLRSAREASRLVSHVVASEFPRQQSPTLFEVRNETTLAAAHRLVNQGERRVLALNFASAKNPGGGFLGGSQAQEESLARATGLYACLMRFPQFYEANRQGTSCLYSDDMIYSPGVPVFRDDDDQLLEAPYRVSMLTSPAVNAGAVRQNEPEHVSQIEPVMRRRMEKVLRIAQMESYDSLVLGAWGCGVFKNSPEAVASWFADHLLAGQFCDVFRRVSFAVFDRTATGEAYRPFVEKFGAGE